MRFNGRAFEGAAFYYEDNRALQSIAGSEYFLQSFLQ
jgi:hypothetical protein